MIENAKPKVDQPQSGNMPSGREVKPKVEEVKPKDQPPSGGMPSGREIKEIKPKEEIKEIKPIKKKKVIKTIVYPEASSPDSDEDEVEEVVKVKKQSKN